MKIKTINSFILIQPVEDHKLYKDELLKQINKLPKSHIKEEHEFYQGRITNSDWHRDRNSKEGYLKIFYEKIIGKPMINIEKFLSAKGWEISNAWFQQYYKNDYHSWHYHVKTQFTNIYYLDIPSPRYKTQVVDICTRKLIEFEIQEGDIVTLPSFLPHRSPVNTSDSIRTVIAFDSSFGGEGIHIF